MADRNVVARPVLRRGLVAALGLCTMWLVIQNCVLLAFVPWSQVPDVLPIFTALFKAAALVVGPLWMLAVASLAGWTLLTWLIHEPRRAAADANWEMDHGRAR